MEVDFPMTNSTTVKASQRLFDEVITSGLCTICGACVGLCPYFQVNRDRGRIQRIDICSRAEGRCQQFCPRTNIDIDMLYQLVFGLSLDEGKGGIGIAREIFLARSRDADILKGGQDGGTVTTLLWTAMREGIIASAIEAKMSDDKSPSGFIARNKEELLQCTGNSYEASAVLEPLNRISRENDENLAVVGLPCQVEAISKMKIYSYEYKVNIANVKLIVGLFCGWAFLPGSFHRFLQSKFNLLEIIKFDIPHHPATTFDVYTKSGKVSIELDEVREFINPACRYCCDMTSQFADISVGSGRTMFKGWNTVIVRSERGEELVELARGKGLLETQPIPDGNVTHLQKAARTKMKRAIQNIKEQISGGRNSGYLRAKPETLHALLKEP